MSMKAESSTEKMIVILYLMAPLVMLGIEAL
jgi:hypothetical protein